MNIYDISEKAGVSIATVSRVLNGNPNVSEKTRNKILNIMEECGYTPNAFARGLMTNSMHTVGILCPDVSDAYLAEAVCHLEHFFREQGYDVLLCCTGYNLPEQQKYMELLLNKKVDGIVLVGSFYISDQPSDNHYIKKIAKQIPIAILNASLHGKNIYSIFCDDGKAVEEATLSLIKHGRRKILYLYNARSYSGSKKLSGYQTAHQVSSLPICEELIQFYNKKDTSFHTISCFLEELSDSGIVFDSIVASEDFLAVGALKYAKKKGLQIPKDLEIIGYNNSKLAECAEPELTSIDNKLEILCEQCTKAIISALEKQNFPEKSVFCAELIHRSTTIDA